MHNRVVSVIGLGYVGLPVAVAFGTQGQCIGFDINSDRIKELKRGFDRTGEVSTSGLSATNLLYTDKIEELRLANFHIVAVPTPVDAANRPELTPLKKVSTTVGHALKKGDIVVYESTVYPGVTEEYCVPILEEVSGLKCGTDFKVGYSPERINPGDKDRTFTKIKKIVSGMDEETLEIVAAVYGSVVKAGVYKTSSIKVAEAAKVIENTQRDLNIALMNELAIIFERMQLDTLEVLEAAGTKWNFLPFRPGLVGGHCIGVDPYYLTYKAELLGYMPQVIQAGRRINDNMGRFVARKGVKLLIQNNHSMLDAKASILGLTFKEDCPDLRNSKVIDVINEFKDYKVQVSVHDALANSEAALHEYGIILNEFENLPQADILVLAVGHKMYKEMDLNYLLSKVKPGGVILDVKSILPKDKIIAAGYILWRL
ncbi:MAG: nucleotide sugar dehydrogenase [Burkholderiales bacterium]|jgi:UDP-N-acetyl-D-galactosamine dehydrogenase|nr:nucleotide sugar dehydrogenase [Burkholderiales bacterium]